MRNGREDTKTPASEGRTSLLPPEPGRVCTPLPADRLTAWGLAPRGPAPRFPHPRSLSGLLCAGPGGRAWRARSRTGDRRWGPVPTTPPLLRAPVAVVTPVSSCQYLRMTGVHPATSFLAWFVESVAVLGAGSAALAAVLRASGVFAHSDASLVFLFLLDFAVSAVTLSYLLSTCFSRADVAALCASLLYMASFLPYIILLVLHRQLGPAAQTLLVSASFCGPMVETVARRRSAPELVGGPAGLPAVSQLQTRAARGGGAGSPGAVSERRRTAPRHTWAGWIYRATLEIKNKRFSWRVLRPVPLSGRISLLPCNARPAKVAFVQVCGEGRGSRKGPPSWLLPGKAHAGHAAGTRPAGARESLWERSPPPELGAAANVRICSRLGPPRGAVCWGVQLAAPGRIWTLRVPGPPRGV